MEVEWIRCVDCGLDSHESREHVCEEKRGYQRGLGDGKRRMEQEQVRPLKREIAAFTATPVWKIAWHRMKNRLANQNPSNGTGEQEQ